MRRNNLKISETLLKQKKINKNNKHGIIQEDFFIDLNEIICIKEVLTSTFIKNKKRVKIIGRIKQIRCLGGITFLVLKEFLSEIQVLLNKKILKKYSLILKSISLFDYVLVEGTLMLNKKKELIVLVDFFIILKKTLLTAKLNNKNVVSKKNFDFSFQNLLRNDKMKLNLLLRSKIISFIRLFLNQRQYLEVETSILSVVSGGENVQSFRTTGNFLKEKLFLRVSPELNLKRFLIAGFNKVYEIGKNFRNEGISKIHYPEFTSIEIYTLFVDYNYTIKLVKELLSFIVIKFFFFIKQEKLENFFTTKHLKLLLKLKNKNWISKTFKEVFLVLVKKEFENISFQEMINFSLLSNLKLNLKTYYNKDLLALEILERLVFKKKQESNFIVKNFPASLFPLSKCKNSFSENADFYLNGIEIATLYSELTDAFLQDKIFKKSKDKDIDFLFSQHLLYGLPKCSGVGIGIDRICSFLLEESDILSTKLI